MFGSIQAELLDKTIKQGLNFLKKEQLSDGEFMTIASSDPLMEKECFSDSSCFITSFILYSLHFFPHYEHVRKITGKALAFLKSQMDTGGIFRYWSGKNSRRDSFPPDLDDTACISAVFQLYGTSYPDNLVFFQENRTAGGLFYTWLLIREKEKQPHSSPLLEPLLTPQVLFNILKVQRVFHYEAAVNANVLFYLGDTKLTCLASDYLVNTILDHKEQEESLYYPNPLSLYYFIARAYAGGAGSLKKIKPVLLERITSHRDNEGRYGSVMFTALALSALGHLGYIAGGPDSDPDRERQLLSGGINFLLNSQHQDGSWKKEPFFLGPAPYYGADALTTGFCLEALDFYRKSF